MNPVAVILTICTDEGLSVLAIFSMHSSIICVISNIDRVECLILVSVSYFLLRVQVAEGYTVMSSLFQYLCAPIGAGMRLQSQPKLVRGTLLGRVRREVGNVDNCDIGSGIEGKHLANDFVQAGGVAVL